MTRDAEAMLLFVMATLVGRLTIQGGYQNYVKTGLFWPLVLSAAVLAAVGAVTWFGGRKVARGAVHGVEAVAVGGHDHGHDGHDGHSHDGHGHDGRIGLLLLAPVMALALVAPAPLGAFAAERGTANQISDNPTIELEALPEPVDGAVNITIGELLRRSFWGEPEDTAGVPLRMIGFAMPLPEGDSNQAFLLTRFAVGCCAADGLVRQARIEGVGQNVEREQWFEVVGTWTGEMRDEFYPVIEVDTFRPIDEPAQPYEY